MKPDRRRRLLELTMGHWVGGTKMVEYTDYNNVKNEEEFVRYTNYGSPFNKAIADNNLEIVGYGLYHYGNSTNNSKKRKGEDFVNQKDSISYTPLMHVAEAEIVGAEEKNTKIATMLLKHPKIDPNIQDEFGKTALHYAVYGSEGGMNPNVVKLLLAHPKIDPNIQDKFGKTALHYAVSKINPNVVELLLDHPKIKTEIKDENDETPYNILESIIVNTRRNEDKDDEDDIERIAQMFETHRLYEAHPPPAYPPPPPAPPTQFKF